jgi:predicted MPP superfamily phosphohydrolase
MGFSFSIKNANAVGHLIEGNVITFLDESSRSPEMLQPNIEFIDRLINRTREDFFTTEIFWRELEADFNWLRETWGKVRRDFEHLRDDGSKETQYLHRNRNLLGFLGVISRTLSRCRVKTMLLPGFNNSRIDKLMRERHFLYDLVHIHPGDSALILQIKERLSESDMAILNVFSKFEKAYNNIDLWPGVLLWNNDDSLFLKVENERDLYDIYEVLRYEKGSFNYLRQNFERKQEKRKHAYFFHISDLHFGYQESNKRKLRLTKILENQLLQLNDNALAVPIITGDLMDIPNDENKNTYLEFCELIKSKGFEEPIQILGNHDINAKIIKSDTHEKAIISELTGQRQIQTIDQLDLAFIKFNSNVGGNLAQGKIGSDQLMNVGTEIDSLKNKERLNFIALLHHHPKIIDNPSWYAEDFYERYLGTKFFEKTMKLVDADIFLQWLENRGIKLVLHGHKHIPKIHMHNDITIVAAGSATGKVKHKEDGKTFLTYNLIKYDIEDKKPVSCSIIAEEILGAGTKNILLHKL